MNTNAYLKPIIVFSIVLIIVWLFLIDYDTLISKNNLSPLLGIIAMIFLIMSSLNNVKSK